MKLSVVFCGHLQPNSTDFQNRAGRALQHNRAILAKAGVEVEWVFVEWNPLPGQDLFVNRIREWLPNVKVLIVDRAIHRQICPASELGMLQFHAKNAGIRRATGEWILATNADTMISPEVADRLKQLASLDKQAVYLANRVDIEKSSLSSSGPLQDFSACRIVRNDQIILPRLLGSCGDFTLANRDVWHSLRGYAEGMTFSNIHNDNHFCCQAQAAGHMLDQLGPVFHVEHAGEAHLLKAQGINFSPHHGADYCPNHVRIPYGNTADWGLADASESPMENNLCRLNRARPDHPDRAHSFVMPPELACGSDFDREARKALEQLEVENRKVVIYGFGNEARQLQAEGKFRTGLIAGCLEDHAPANTMPYPLRTWSGTPVKADEVIWIGSRWWCYDLAARVCQEGLADRLYPVFLRTRSKFSMDLSK